MQASVETLPSADGYVGSLLHVANDGPAGTPVLLVHGAGVRANIFDPPTERTLIDCLMDAGYDVWLSNWRASIDGVPNRWTLDEAAVFDHPAAVKTVLERTGATSIKAVIHCQGSTSFMMAAVAGLLPQVETIVSNAVALHPVVPRATYLANLALIPTLGRMIDGLNPQWGLSAPAGWPTVIDWVVRATHHECNNPVCKHASFTYGLGFPTLWRHENLDEATHEWIKGEFAYVPTSFFLQMTRCLSAGHLVSTGRFAELPENFVEQAPKTDARFVLLGGENNVCFLPESQARTFDFLDHHHPGRHVFHELAGYGHLDVFLGKDAARDVFPLIVDELGRS